MQANVIQKGAQLRGHVPPTGIVQEEPREERAERLQQRDEFAPLDPGPEGVFQAERDTAARNRHMKRLYTSCLAYNRSMQALARKFKADLTFETDEVLGVLEAPDATSATQFNEALDDATGFATAVLDLQRRWFNPFQTFRIFSPGQH